MKNKKKLLCAILSLIMVVTAIYAAYQKPKEVHAVAVEISTAAAIAALLAGCGMVYTGVAWWQDGSAAENLDDLYGDEIGEIKEEKFVPIFQECMENLNIRGGDDFNPEEDDPNDKVPSFEKLIQWIKLHPGETIMTTGTALAAVLLKFANALKDDVEVNDSLTSDEYTRCENTLTELFPGIEFYRGTNHFDGPKSGTWYWNVYNADKDYVFATAYDSELNCPYNYFYKTGQPNGTVKICLRENNSGFTIYYNNSNYFQKVYSNYAGSSRGTSSSYDACYLGYNGSYYDKICVSNNCSIELYDSDGNLLDFNESPYLSLNSGNVKYGSTVEIDDNNEITALPVPQINASALAQNWPQILPALQNQLALGLDPAEKVDEIINTVGTAPSEPPSIAPDIGESPELEPLPEIEGVEGLDKLSFLLPEEITEKFPFCVPFDIIRAFRLFDSAERNAPHFEVPIKAERYGIDEKIVIDLSDFNSVAALLRNMELILFIIGLAYVSRDLIKG